MPPVQASSATTGFFQSPPFIHPQYTSQQNSENCNDTGDVVLTNIAHLYLPLPLPQALDRSLHDFARKCLDPSVLRLSVDSEKNIPSLHPMTTFGQDNGSDALRTGEGWRGLKDIQTQAGIVGYGYVSITGDFNYNLRAHQFLLAHLWAPSSTVVTCPAAMTDGAALLISKRLRNTNGDESALGQDPKTLKPILQQVYDRLTSLNPSYAWTSGQWMTERTGGSDVSRSETVARLATSDELHRDSIAFGKLEEDTVGMPLGPYIIDGFKWFSSATDADVTVLLAQTEHGLSTFYAPMKRVKLLSSGRKVVVMNGVRISRLKDKLGTKALPTAELEIKGMRAWLLGGEGRGVREISSILNVTRLWTATGALGGWSRGLAVARAYAKVRTIKGDQFLADNKQHVKWMADETVKYRACMHFAFLGVALMGVADLGWEMAGKGTKASAWLPTEQTEAEAVLRVLTPVMKSQCSYWSTLGLRECMESMGGVGYCENNEDEGLLNLARIFRDTNVNPIWEGTTSVLAEDFVRASTGRGSSSSMKALDGLVNRLSGSINADYAQHANSLRRTWSELSAWIAKTPGDQVLYNGRQILRQVYEILSSLLLMVDASNNPTVLESIVAARWASSKFGTPGKAKDYASTSESEHDRMVFFGHSTPLEYADASRARL